MVSDEEPFFDEGSFIEPSTGPQRHGKRSPWRIALIAGAALAAFVLAFFGSLAWNLIRGVSGDGDIVDELPSGDTVTPPRIAIHPDEPINILLIGVDGNAGSLRSDSVMLLSIDPLTERVGLLGIPRDTLVEIPLDQIEERLHRHIYENPTKLAHTHAYGGATVTMATVGALLDVPVHRFVRANFNAFVNIVDILGGIEICIEREMHYEDPYQDLYIHFYPGCQVLNGRDSLKYVRYRQDSDFKRIERQQQALMAMVDRAMSLGMIPRLPNVVNELVTHVDTNLSESELVALARRGMGMAGDYAERLQTGTLEGRDARMNGVYYFIHDEEAKQALVEQLIWQLEQSRDASLVVRILHDGRQRETAAALRALLDAYGHTAVVMEDPEAAATEVVLHDESVAAKLIARYLAHRLDVLDLYNEPAPEPIPLPGGDQEDGPGPVRTPAVTVVLGG